MDVPKVKCVLDSQSISNQRYYILRKTLGRGSFSKVYLGYICGCSCDYKCEDEGIFDLELNDVDLNTSGCDELNECSNRNQRECLCNIQTAEKVAVKVMQITKKKSRKVLLNEIEIMKELHHDNILNFIDVIDEEKNDSGDSSNENPKIYIVLEYCGGGDLKHYLGSNRRLKEKYAKYYFKQIAKGLRYLHSNSIVHRDLKPQNILLSDDKKTLKIADFGFAKIIGSESLAETMCGSPLYMAPEIMKGKKYTSTSDLWSVGVMMYEALTGIHPFGGANSIYELIEKIERHSKRNVLKFPRGVTLSQHAKDILRKLLKANPNERMEWETFFGHPFFNDDKSKSGLLGKPDTLKKPSKSISVPQRRTISKHNFAFSPPSFIHSPRVKKTVNISIIDDYSNHHPRVNSLSESSQRSLPNQQRSTTTLKSSTKAMSYISDYLGASWSLLKDSMLN